MMSDGNFVLAPMGAGEGLPGESGSWVTRPDWVGGCANQLGRVAVLTD